MIISKMDFLIARNSIAKSSNCGSKRNGWFPVAQEPNRGFRRRTWRVRS